MDELNSSIVNCRACLSPVSERSDTDRRGLNHTTSLPVTPSPVLEGYRQVTQQCWIYSQSDLVRVWSCQGDRTLTHLWLVFWPGTAGATYTLSLFWRGCWEANTEFGSANSCWLCHNSRIWGRLVTQPFFIPQPAWDTKQFSLRNSANLLSSAVRPQRRNCSSCHSVRPKKLCKPTSSSSSQNPMMS